MPNTSSSAVVAKFPTTRVCWPVAVLHGLGAGTDAKLGIVLGTNVVCVVAVLAAVWWRLAVGWPEAANTLARKLARRPDLADRLVGIAGDFVPARAAFGPGFLLELITA